MSKAWNKPKPVAPGSFVADIGRNQSAERKARNGVLRRVRSVYLRNENDELLESEMEFLLDEIELELNPGGDTPRPPAVNRGGRVLLVTGAAGAGKTRALATTFLSRPEFVGFGQPGEACVLLSVVAPSPFTLKALGNEIVRKIGYVGERDIPEGEVWPMIRILMRELGIRIIHIDEAQHGDQITNAGVHQAVENTLKRLLQDAEWPLWLILSGLPELANFCQSDQSVARRVRHVPFPSLSFPDHVETVRDTIAAVAAPCKGLDLSRVASDEFAHRLLHASLCQFGILVEFVQDAIMEQLRSGGNHLDPIHFADAYTARTGERRDRLNVFLADDWNKIDVTAALFEQPVDDEGNPEGRPQLKPSASGRE